MDNVAILRCLCSSHLRRLLGVRDREQRGRETKRWEFRNSRAAMTVQCRHQSDPRGCLHEAIVRFESPLPPTHPRSLFFFLFTDTFEKRRGRWGTLVRGARSALPTHPCQPNSGTALFRLPARRVHSSASQDQQGSAMGIMDRVES